MDKTYTLAAERSVHAVHELIQTIFAGEPGMARAAMGQLMPVFAEGFSMVTTAGAVVQLPQVAAMFQQAAGGRPGLRIEISDVATVWQAASSVALRYKETHHLNGTSTARWATAIVDCADGDVRWHSLHETALSR
ncbi:DUF4440 domain-containing protein [Comamonas sp.]|uniref:DUF4440 domain-containing protein n=1 Tax=Comamonas sp. TaxID=34028 RepID=UPI002899F660|nr:DUF4440 domain-containing protein [Comamonas sp.]